MTIAATGWIACLAALVTGAWPIMVLAAAALYGLGAWVGRAPLALLAAPLVLAATAPVGSLLQGWAAAWWLIALVATVPLLLRLGGALPWRGLSVAVVAPGVVMMLAFHAWAPTVFSSDVAARLQVVLLGMAAVLWLTVSRAWAQRVRPPPW